MLDACCSPNGCARNQAYLWGTLRHFCLSISAFLATFYWWFALLCFGLGRGPITPPSPAMVQTDPKDLNSNKTTNNIFPLGAKGMLPPQSAPSMGRGHQRHLRSMRVRITSLWLWLGTSSVHQLVFASYGNMLLKSIVICWLTRAPLGGPCGFL